MEFVGIPAVVSDYRTRVAVECGDPIYASVAEERAEMEIGGIPAAMSFNDLLGTADVVVECTPKGVAARNKDVYAAAGVKGTFEGAEETAEPEPTAAQQR